MMKKIPKFRKKFYHLIVLMIMVLCFGDKNTANKILVTDDVAEIKALGRLVANYNESYWNGVRQIIVFEGLLAKFSQNENLKKQLKAT